MATMSPLRRRMIDDMMVRNLSPATQQSYIYAVAKFSRHFNRSPDRLGLEEVRAYQLHLIAQKRSWPTRSIRLRNICTPDRRCLIAAGLDARRRGDRAVSRSGSWLAQPGGADYGLWRWPARGRGRASSGERDR